MIIGYQMLIWLLHKVSPARCTAAYVLGNLLVPIGFWAFIIGCSLNLSGTETTFHSIDRYIRQLKEFNKTAAEDPPPSALIVMLLREALLHGLVQFQCVASLAYGMRNIIVNKAMLYVACKDIVAFFAFWIMGSLAFSPEMMPYEPLPPTPFATLAVVLLASLRFL